MVAQRGLDVTCETGCHKYFNEDHGACAPSMGAFSCLRAKDLTVAHNNNISKMFISNEARRRVG